jgi:VanZ family protein
VEPPKLARIIENRTLWARLFWLYFCALTIALLWPNMTMPPVGVRPDLLGHYVAFGLLALLICLWNPLGTRNPVWNALATLAAGTAYGGATEMLQSIPVLKRSAGWDDWVADVLGVGCGLVVYFVVRRLGRSR